MLVIENLEKRFKNAEAAARRYSKKELFLQISQNSQESTSTPSLFFCKIFKNTVFYGTLPVATSNQSLSSFFYYQNISTTFVPLYILFLPLGKHLFNINH